MGTIERKETSIKFLLTFFLVASLYQLVAFTDKVLGLSKILGGELFLNSHELFYQWLILLKHLVVTLGNRTRDNQRCTGIINQHRVDLIDNSIIV